MPRTHRERHRTERIGWLRAAVLGANDGIVSTASLVIGVAAASAARGDVLIAGVAGLVAGAMSMAAGEYVSVKSQADTEAADLARERSELAADAAAEHREAGWHLRQARARCGIGRPGRDAADGARCAGRSRTRRTRHLRDAERATGAGRAFVGGQLHRGRGVAAAGRSFWRRRGFCRRRSRAVRWCSWQRWARWLRRAGGASAVKGALARHVLGRAGDGHHGRGRCPVRDSGGLRRESSAGRSRLDRWNGGSLPAPSPRLADG